MQLILTKGILSASSALKGSLTIAMYSSLMGVIDSSDCEEVGIE